MSWPILFAQTPATPAAPATVEAPPAAPATPIDAAPAAPTTPIDAAPTTPIDAAPATPTDAVPVTPATPGSVPADVLNTPVVPATDMTPTTVQPGQPPMDMPTTDAYASGLSGSQWTVLVIFAGVCVGLISCVLFSTSKSDLGGAIAGGGATAPFRGKKSGEEQLTQVTQWFAMAFIVMSLAMAFIFRL